MPKRTVLVTGSSRGIGYGIAKAYAEQGDRVIINGKRDKERLISAVKELRRLNGDITGVMADVSAYEGARELMRCAEAEYGPVEVLVNNAGTAHYGLFSDMKPCEWERLTRDNINSVYNMVSLAAPGMVRAKRGVIINITSIWGNVGASCEAVYASCKGAVNIFTKSMAKELGPSGVRVNAIACGAFETRMNARLTAEEKSAFTAEIPLMRFGRIAEAGRLAVFISSEEASYLTGQVITLDGGYT